MQRTTASIQSTKITCVLHPWTNNVDNSLLKASNDCMHWDVSTSTLTEPYCPPCPLPRLLSAGACTARQCPVASEMACQPWGIPRGRGIQTQAQAVVACPPLSFLPTNRSATRRNIPYSQARRPAVRRCSCPSPSTLHVSRRSGGATVPSPPPVHVSRRSDGATPHPTPSPLVLACGRSHGCSPPLPLTTRPIVPPAEWPSGQPHELLSGSRGFDSFPSPCTPNTQHRKCSKGSCTTRNCILPACITYLPTSAIGYIVLLPVLYLRDPSPTAPHSTSAGASSHRT